MNEIRTNHLRSWVTKYNFDIFFYCLLKIKGFFPSKKCSSMFVFFLSSDSVKQINLVIFYQPTQKHLYYFDKQFEYLSYTNLTSIFIILLRIKVCKSFFFLFQSAVQQRSEDRGKTVVAHNCTKCNIILKRPLDFITTLAALTKTG